MRESVDACYCLHMSPQSKVSAATSAYRESRNMLGKCKACRKGIRGTFVLDGNLMVVEAPAGEWRVYGNAYDAYMRCDCGAMVLAKWLHGTTNTEKTCDGRCMSATGPSCDCECGGEGHGANWSR